MYVDIKTLVWAIVAPSTLQFLAQPLLSAVLAAGQNAIQRNPKVVALIPAFNIAVGSTASYVLVAHGDWVTSLPNFQETLRGLGVAATATLIASVALFVFSIPTLWVARDARWQRQVRAVAVAFTVGAPLWTCLMLGLLRILIPFTGEASIQVALSANAIASTLLVQLAVFWAIARNWLGYPPEENSSGQGD